MVSVSVHGSGTVTETVSKTTREAAGKHLRDSLCPGNVFDGNSFCCFYVHKNVILEANL